MAFETGDEQQQQLSATAASALQQLQHLLASLTKVCTNSTANLVAFTTRVIKIVRLVAETTCFFHSWPGNMRLLTRDSERP